MLGFLRGHRRGGFTLIEIMVAILILGILIAIAIPGFGKARESARIKSCAANLKRIHDAKEQYATDQGKQVGDPVLFANIAPDYLKSMPECPSGGTYTPEPVGQPPTCSTPGHEMQ